MIILGFITLIYVLLIIQFVVGFHKVAPYIEDNADPHIGFTIVIPFRNEAENLPRLLKSLKAVDYPDSLFEIILIDDHSTDDSEQIIRNFAENSNMNISVYVNDKGSSSPKKEAITLAISKSNFDWIITTDADCLVPSKWLKVFNSFIIANNSDLIAAPVTQKVNRSFFQQFQLLEFLSLQSVTIGGFGIGNPFLCNGANLAYKKSCFNELQGFKGNMKSPSGDDVFILQKAINHGKKVHYLKSLNALVYTSPEDNLGLLIQQRIRWASKARMNKSFLSRFTAVIVFLMNSSLIIAIALVMLNHISVYHLLILCLIKFTVDFLCIQNAAIYLKQSRVLLVFLFASIIYPFFSIYAALMSLYSGFKWKDRVYSS